MSEADRRHWDERYADLGMAPLDADPDAPPPIFSHVEERFPREGVALEVACGRGRGVVWLARRGLDVWAVDVSPVAIDLTRRLAESYGVSDRCHLLVHDLDRGLPDTPPADLVLCYLYREPKLDGALMDRMAPGGLLAIATLSEVDVGPGRFRARPGELQDAFGALEIIEEGERDGNAWLLGRR